MQATKTSGQDRKIARQPTKLDDRCAIRVGKARGGKTARAPTDATEPVSASWADPQTLHPTQCQFAAQRPFRARHLLTCLSPRDRAMK
jgi:hypothetical protein